MKDIDRYQRERAEENGVIDHDKAVVLYSLGIAGEAGEVADYMKKVLGHGKTFDRKTLVEELGDVMWYVSQLAYTHDIPMSEILAANTSKNRERYPFGFNGNLPLDEAR